MPLTSSLCALALFSQTSTVEVPFRVGERAMIVDATVNGAQVSCMFDTGFSGCVVLNNNIDIGKATGTINLQDFVGVFQDNTTKVKSLKLGSKVINPTGME